MVDFPKPEVLRTLAEQPVEGNPLQTDERVVERWDFQTALANGVGPARSDFSPYAGLPVNPSMLQPTDAIASPQMRCFASEMGAFLLQHGGVPSSALRDSMAAHCGAMVDEPRFLYVVQGPVERSALEKQFAEAVDRTLQDAPSGAQVGFWGGGDATRTAIVATYGTSNVTYAASTLAPGADNSVTVTGTIAYRAEWSEAYVTHGPVGYATCERHGTDPSHFSFKCPLDPRDTSALIELRAARPGRVLGHREGLLMVSPNRSGAPSFSRRTVNVRGLGDEVPLDRQIVAAINGVRSTKSLAPLTISPAQSRIAAELVPMYLSTARNPRGATVQDTIAMGMMAGWQLEHGLIRDATFGSIAFQASDVSEAISQALHSPAMRALLLGPDSESIALGLVQDPTTKNAAALLSTYALFNPAQRDLQAQSVLDQLDRARRASGQAVVKRVGGEAYKTLLRAEERINQDGMDPERALKRALQQAVDHYGLAMNAIVFETSDFSRIRFPEGMTTASGVQIATLVTHRRLDPTRWGEYVVLMLFVTD